MIRLLLAIAALATAPAPQPAETADGPGVSQADASYAVGVDLAMRARQEGVQLDREAVLRGFADALHERKLALTEAELQRALAYARRVARSTRARTLATLSKDNARESAAFLAANRMKPGVVGLESGVQYEILREGQGKRARDGDTVEVSYRGTLFDGSEFDATPAGKTAALELKRLVPGLREALLLMPVGSRWRVFVPPALAYGPRSFGRNIPPNSALVFDVELLAIR